MGQSETAPERAAIVVYSGPRCSGCDEVKAYLTAHGIAYEERNIRADIETMIAFRRKGYEIVPVIELGTETITEYESLPQLEAALRAGGYLG